MVFISGLNYSLGFDWLARGMRATNVDMVFVLLNDNPPDLLGLFRSLGYKSHFVPYSGKRDIPMAAYLTAKLIISERPDTVHAHLFDACLIALPIAKLLGVHHRIYTRHHSTFHHVYHPGMVKYDRFINYCATDIIAISRNVWDVLTQRENCPERKLKLIHHGFDLRAFSYPDEQYSKVLRDSLGIAGHHPVVGVISRYTEWKGVQYIIPAFHRLLEFYPNARLVLANAKGEYSVHIKSLLSKLPAGTFVEIGFEKDIFTLYSIFDIFVHVPVDQYAEAFGQTYVEALAAQVPSVFTLSGIASEFVVDKENAIVVPYRSVDAIFEALMLLLENKPVCDEMRLKGKSRVDELFEVNPMIMAHLELYER